MTNKRWLRGFQIAKAASVHSNGVSVSKRLGAALFSGSTLVAVGFNVWNQTHPDSRTHRFDRNLHAEHKAILKRQHYENAAMIMYVYRETTDGKPACSRPCSNCMVLLKEAGVARVRFIEWNGKYTEIKV